MAAKTMNLKTEAHALAKKTDYKRKTEETHVISPEVAAAWLTKNVSNRRPRANHIRRLAIAMRNGLWRETDDPIRFDWDGNLFDGQHRLMACVEAGAPFKSRVIYGYAPEMRHVVDCGIQRTPADSIAMAGVKNASNVAAVLRLLAFEAMGVRINNPRRAPTKDHIETMLRLHPRLPLFVLCAGTLPRGLPLPYISAISYIAATITEEPEVAGRFVAVFKTGVPSYDGCPLHRYRERILAGQGFDNRAESWEALKHCYNKWIAGEKMAFLRGGDHLSGVQIQDLEPKDLTKGAAIFDQIEEEDAE